MAKRRRSGRTDDAPRHPRQPVNPGLPDPKTVISERVLVSPKGRQYRILRTTEKDPYDPPDDPDRKKK